MLSPEMDSLYFSDQTCCIFLIREFNDDGARVMNESTAMKLSFTARSQLMVTQRIHAIIHWWS